ncbi:Leucine-rich repeat-containing protein 15 [Merluccius polli]|uniref:Leucine-rich repeat-containing protein 15 n=1 Tax=Merluccius polli TaxID=89951 RepID=A0AA47M518_MERPO|nr:Leucine-rich repeat-containing protein 15 [Merluccius polli]
MYEKSAVKPNVDFEKMLSYASRLNLALLCLTLLGPRQHAGLSSPLQVLPQTGRRVSPQHHLAHHPIHQHHHPCPSTTSAPRRFLEGLHLYNNHLRSLLPTSCAEFPRLPHPRSHGNRLAGPACRRLSATPRSPLVLKNNLMETAKAEWLPDDSSLTGWTCPGSLTGVPAALFKKLPHLESLDLSHNRPGEDSGEIPGHTDQTREVEPAENKLVSLDPLLFHNTVNITNLYLTANRLDKLSPSLFQGLGKLSVLGLEDNQLGHVPPGLFDPLTSLDEQGLDLTANLAV